MGIAGSADSNDGLHSERSEPFKCGEDLSPVVNANVEQVGGLL